MNDLIKLPEPRLLFGHGQEMEDPRDGLTLFGPLDEGRPDGVQFAVIGQDRGISLFKDWVQRVQGPVSCHPGHPARPPFPGFEAVFDTPWAPRPALEIRVPEAELAAAMYLDEIHQRVYGTVEAYCRRMVGAAVAEEAKPDIWFVVVPDEVYRYCRPESRVEPERQIRAQIKLKAEKVRELQQSRSLWKEYNEAAIAYEHAPNFHNQLKARLLRYLQPTQVVKESTLAVREPEDTAAWRRQADPSSAIAWNMCSTTFYKVGGRPWKLSGVRDGVCYVGVVFKRDSRKRDPRWACCAAQMFLDSGDGFVFRGAVGPWYSPDRREYHLSRKAARELVSIAVETYRQKRGGLPGELFLHGKVRFRDDEWSGFADAVDHRTNIVGVRIRDTGELKLFTQGTYPVLRGLCYVQDETTAYLWTKGLTPRLQTYPGRETPNPVLVDICRGRADIDVVVRDILGLTKLNYNACQFSDGLPITLKFADFVGQILTSSPIDSEAPLPFKYYI